MARIVHGNHPYDAPKDKPMRVGREQVGYFTYPDIQYLGSSDLNTLYVSTDKLTLGYYELSPGAQFSPADHHPGDECYYILEGNLWEVNCFSGQTCKISVGESLLIPHSAAHGGYNFGTKKMKAVFALSPNMVKPGEQTFPTDLEGEWRVLNGVNEDKYVKYPPKAQNNILGSIDSIGNWPVSDSELRKNPKYLRVTHENEKLDIINGYDNPYLMRFAFSTKYINFGEIILPAGSNGCRISDKESHKGQTAIYVESGCLSFIITSTRETFKICPDEVMYIPENCEYQMMNYESEPVHAIFAISEL
jgi:mannose-6-phosphate isomerase-like protein (cupin superfamily)